MCIENKGAVYCSHCNRETWHTWTLNGRPRTCQTCLKPADKEQHTLTDFIPAV